MPSKIWKAKQRTGGLSIILLLSGAMVTWASGCQRIHVEQTLVDAALRDDVKEMRALLNAGTDVNISETDGSTALFVAALNGHTHSVSYLLENKANPNVRTDHGLTPLMGAAMGNPAYLFDSPSLAIAELLEAHGADINARTTKSPRGQTALMFAAIKGNHVMVEFLMSKGADVDALTEEGKTALSYAKENGRDRVVKLLTIREAQRMQNNEGRH